MTIYALRAGPFIKIGYTAAESPKDRLKSVSTGCPFPVQIVGQCPGPRQREQYLHCVLRDVHAVGEWFYESAALRATCLDHGLAIESPDMPATFPGCTVTLIDLRSWQAPSDVVATDARWTKVAIDSAARACPGVTTASYLVDPAGMRGRTVSNARATRCINEDRTLTRHGQEVADTVAGAAEAVYHALRGNYHYHELAARLLSRVPGATALLDQLVEPRRAKERAFAAMAPQDLQNLAAAASARLAGRIGRPQETPTA